MKQVTIYTLSCPIEKTIKYVGATSRSLIIRLIGHISSPPNKNMKDWVCNLKKQNETPIIEEIATYEISVAAYFERYWIMQLKSWGYTLLNITLPNEGYKYSICAPLQSNNIFELEKILPAPKTKLLNKEPLEHDPVVKRLIEMYEEEKREEKRQREEKKRKREQKNLTLKKHKPWQKQKQAFY